MSAQKASGSVIVSGILAILGSFFAIFGILLGMAGVFISPPTKDFPSFFLPVALVAFVFMTAPNVNMGIVSGLMALFYGAPILVAVWWLILFNKQSIKAQFCGKRRSFPLAIGLHAFWMISGLVTFLMPNYRQNMQELFSEMPVPESSRSSLQLLHNPAFVFIMLVGVLILSLLFCNRKHFLEASASANFDLAASRGQRTP